MFGERGGMPVRISMLFLKDLFDGIGDQYSVGPAIQVFLAGVFQPAFQSLLQFLYDRKKPYFWFLTLVERRIAHPQTLLPYQAAHASPFSVSLQGGRIMSDTVPAGYEEGPNKVIRLAKKHIVWLLRCSKTKIRFLRPLHAINILEINRFSGLVPNAANWIPGLRCMFQLRKSRKRWNPAVLSTPGLYAAPPGMTTAGTIVLESGRC